MGKKEIVFNKYRVKSSDYHYREIKSFNFFSFNLYLLARYEEIIEGVGKIIENIKNKGEKIKILDLGCGDGVLLFLLNTKYAKELDMYGVDLSKDAIKIAKVKVKNAKFYVGTVYRTAFSDNYFDIVISSDVIEHLSVPNNMLREIKRVLKNGGKAVVGTPIKITEEPQDKMHCHEFYPNEFRIELGKVFKKVDVIKSHPLILFLLINKVLTIGRFRLPIFQYAINIIYLVLGINPFLTNSRNNEKTIFSYMFAICQK